MPSSSVSPFRRSFSLSVIPRTSSHVLLGVTLAAVLQTTSCGPQDWDSDIEGVSSKQQAVHTVCAVNSEKTYGIDVSKWQGSINWNSVAADGVVFAIARVSYGIYTKDKYFDANWKGIRAAGIIRGAYQYYRSGQDPIEQAKLFVEMVEQSGGWQAGDLPPVLDLEENDSGLSKSAFAAKIEKWIQYMEQHTGRRPIIYTGSYFWDHNVGSHFSEYPLWGPNYTTAACPKISSNWEHWTIWQFSDKGSVSGINTSSVDENWFDGNKQQLVDFVNDSLLGGGTGGAGGSGGAGGAGGGAGGGAAGSATDGGVVLDGSEQRWDASLVDGAIMLPDGAIVYLDGSDGQDSTPTPPSHGATNWETERGDGCACSLESSRQAPRGVVAWFGLAALGLALVSRRRFST